MQILTHTPFHIHVLYNRKSTPKNLYCHSGMKVSVVDMIQRQNTAQLSNFEPIYWMILHTLLEYKLDHLPNHDECYYQCNIIFTLIIHAMLQDGFEFFFFKFNYDNKNTLGKIRRCGILHATVTVLDLFLMNVKNKHNGVNLSVMRFW